MKRSIKSLLLFTFFALVAVTFFSSCHKTKDTVAKIIVKDKDNALIVGAWVRVYGNSTTTSTSIINDSVISDANGEAKFNYNKIYKAGQAGVAVLEVVGRKSNLYGKTVIKIEAEVENTASVFIQPQ